MSKGRKRRSAQREPSGKIARPLKDGTRAEYAPAEIARIRWGARNAVVNAKMGSALGRLSMLGIIDDLQFSAGLRFHEIDCAWRIATGFRGETVKAQNPNVVKGTSGDLPDDMAEACERMREGVRQALIDVGGQPLVTLVSKVCVQDEDIGWIDHQAACKGLELLVAYWGMRQRKLAIAS